MESRKGILKRLANKFGKMGIKDNKNLENLPSDEKLSPRMMYNTKDSVSDPHNSEE
jgi:hypothetical protein